MPRIFHFQNEIPYVYIIGRMSTLYKTVFWLYYDFLLFFLKSPLAPLRRIFKLFFALPGLVTQLAGGILGSGSRSLRCDSILIEVPKDGGGVYEDPLNLCGRFLSVDLDLLRALLGLLVSVFVLGLIFTLLLLLTVECSGMA